MKEITKENVTVREIFQMLTEKSLDVYTCHIGSWGGPTAGNFRMEPTVMHTMVGPTWPSHLSTWANHGSYEFPLGPDISDRPASSFIGFFGGDYTDAYDALPEGK